MGRQEWQVFGERERKRMRVVRKFMGRFSSNLYDNNDDGGGFLTTTTIMTDDGDDDHSIN